MLYQGLLILLFVFLTIPGAEAVNTDYSTLEALCIAILVIFIIWVIVIIILICVCKKYIDKAPERSADDSCDGGGGETNVAYVRQDGSNSQGAYRRKSSPKVAPEPHRPEMSDQGCQTNPRYLEPLGPDVGLQTNEEDE